MAKKKRKPDSPIGLDKILTPAEETKFTDHMASQMGEPEGAKLYLIFDLMLMTGIRVSELCNLRVKDTPGYLGMNAVRVYLGKNKKNRDIPVSKRMAANIRTYRKDLRPQTLPAHVRASDSRQRMFYSSLKKPFTRRGLGYQIARCGRLAGIVKHLTPHMCRHTFATRALMDSKINLPELQIFMGHAKITTTQSYIHLVTLLTGDYGERLDRSEIVI